ncbi:hypothetical protein CYMTET_16594 [Cymbomonas tetramitiformis]|uniref:Uncharacterized protein n=1 Tax=Cymbomonas tetramitiformis TaxID=36881 RepID=A0AAE0L7S6_9CHLO|nr:hypothetical protein CYMTET_16594 [Cymbomonas tetramitiformis]
MRLDSIFARNVGARYRSTPQSAHATLAATDKTRGNAVLQSSWDDDVVKRVAKDTLGNKASSFSGSEPHRQLLWDSLVTALETSFVTEDNANEDIFDLVDVAGNDTVTVIMVTCHIRNQTRCPAVTNSSHAI